MGNVPCKPKNVHGEGRGVVVRLAVLVTWPCLPARVCVCVYIRTCAYDRMTHLLFALYINEIISYALVIFYLHIVN